MAAPLFAALLGACDPQPTEGFAEALPPPSGAIAVTVEGDSVAATSVALVASAQALETEAALDAVVHDALLAARARRLLDPSAVQLLTRTVLARALAVDDWHSLRGQPIAAEELQEATAAHWTEYARPEGRRTAHAVVLAGKEDSAEHHVRARAMAARILEAVRGPVASAEALPAPELDGDRAFAPGAFDKDPLLKAFRHAALALERDSSLRIVAEELASVTRDGRQIRRGLPDDQSGFDLGYTDAAWKLARRGQLSDVVPSAFGYHVIVLLETTPARLVGEDARREALRSEILKVRGKRQRRALLAELAAATPISLASNHEALLDQIDLRPAKARPAENSAPGAGGTP